MYKLVVLLALVGIAASKPSHIHAVAPVAYSTSVAEIPIAVSHQFRADIISKPVVATVAAPVVQKTIINASPVAAVPIVQKTIVSEVAPALAYTAIPVTGTTYTKNVHYAQSDIVTGYTSQVIKPNLGSLVTPLETVSKSAVLAPTRAVETITPTVTQVEPEVPISKVSVDVPVQTPIVSEVEVHSSKLAQPSIAYSAPTVAAGYAINVAPVATSYVVNVAPRISGFSLSAPLRKIAYAGPSVSTSYAWNAAPVLAPAVTSYSTAPAVLTSPSAISTTEVRQEVPLYTEAKIKSW
ncbi:hypothetical protein NQ314_003404 [Rhamnusium bicolor]|uniref:Uncharacterized protein n=1 Tax=Rhamnusium bicolor TaxID=1586634 RepID=A0AAV8ZP21_9CUCU|nr:hypothetical protein NQ314_003404 [Rhamnusium bicolor]